MTGERRDMQLRAVFRHASRAILFMVGVINLARGLTHFIARDSAAGAAGISTENAGGTDIIYLFAIIGGVQIVLALFYIYVSMFHRHTLPLALVMEIAKTGLNLFIGYDFKPSQAEAVAGSGQDKLQLALSVLALIIFALTQKDGKSQGKLAMDK